MSAPNEPSPPSSKSESAVPLSMKLILIGGGILVMLMFVFTLRSIIGIFYQNSAPSATPQANTETVAAHSQQPAAASASSDSGSPKPAVLPSNWPTPTASAPPEEIAKQRKQARIASLEALQQERRASDPEYETRRKAMIKAAKRELLEQAGTSGVPKEVLQKIEQSDPIIY